MTWKSPDLTGRTYAITGGNTGIGYFISEQLTAAGADVVILARNADRARAAAAAIRSRTGKAVAATLPLDLADLGSVATAAAELSRPMVDRDRLPEVARSGGEPLRSRGKPIGAWPLAEDGPSDEPNDILFRQCPPETHDSYVIRDIVEYANSRDGQGAGLTRHAAPGGGLEPTNAGPDVPPHRAGG